MHDLSEKQMLLYRGRKYIMHIYDVEVFAYDWIVIFKNVASGEYTIIHNDNEAVKQFMANDPLLGGFNNKHYDNHILKAILCGADNALVKEINDFIIGGGNGWEHSWLSQQRGIWFNSFDLSMIYNRDYP